MATGRRISTAIERRLCGSVVAKPCLADREGEASCGRNDALVRHEPLPDPDALRVPYSAYLNGMGEAVGELRRHVLDQIRTRGAALSESILQAMDDIYYVLVSMDYPAAISGGLKRTADVTRSIIEKTRGDLTSALRSQQLEEVIRTLEARLTSK